MIQADLRCLWVSSKGLMMRARLLEFVPGLVAGVAGGIGGYLLVAYLIRSNNIWVPILPGAFAGLACGQLSSVYSRRRGVVMAVIVSILIVYAQWKLFNPPFEFDGSLGDYVLHLYQLPPLTLLVMAVNVVIGYWWGRERGIGFGRGGRVSGRLDA